MQVHRGTLLFVHSQAVTDFADASHSKSVKCTHHSIVRNFQFRKFLPVYSSTDTSALKRKEIVNISFLSDNICIDYNKNRYKKQRYIIL